MTATSYDTTVAAHAFTLPGPADATAGTT